MLEMVEHASRSTGLAVEDAWAEASATSRLSERDQDLIKAFVARASLFDAVKKDWQPKIGTMALDSGSPDGSRSVKTVS